ncbi:Tetratricopeptide-like helical domain superfamily [Forsythia ovata]|uniref:Tetratricopeptide-like helical domain superfamily n=1 Tax=Forsythia ovata TaxID=205694 RepID=A0ABD1Q126_9LAMI
MSLYGLVPSLEHYSCLINLLYHAGELDRAWKLVAEMPHSGSQRFVQGGLLSVHQHFGQEQSPTAVLKSALKSSGNSRVIPCGCFWLKTKPSTEDDNSLRTIPCSCNEKSVAEILFLSQFYSQSSDRTRGVKMVRAARPCTEKPGMGRPRRDRAAPARPFHNSVHIVPTTRAHPSIYNPPDQGTSDTGGKFRLRNFPQKR